eukprot:4615916-Amphidinium_carterae.1
MGFGGVSRVLVPLPPLTKELERRQHVRCRTTKVLGGSTSTSLGKASMPQITHPSLCFLGGVWFKICWLNTPRSPARQPHQQDTAGRIHAIEIAACQLVTTDQKHQCRIFLHCDMFASLQPFEHRLPCPLPCRSSIVAQPLPDVAPCGRVSGTTCTTCPAWDLACILQFDLDALMRRFWLPQLQQLRAWRTGDAENDYCSTTWQKFPTRTLILGNILKEFQGYRTSHTEFAWTNREPDVVGKRIAPTAFPCWLPTIRQGTGDVADVEDPVREMSPFGYTIVLSSEYVATTCVKITVIFPIVWMYRYHFVQDIMGIYRDAVPPLTIQMRLSESSPLMTDRPHLGSTTFLADKGRQENRLLETSQVRSTDKEDDELSIFVTMHFTVARVTGTSLYTYVSGTDIAFSFGSCMHVSLEPLQHRPHQLLAKEKLAYPWIPSETITCWRHTTPQERRTDTWLFPLHLYRRTPSLKLQKKISLQSQEDRLNLFNSEYQEHRSAGQSSKQYLALVAVKQENRLLSIQQTGLHSFLFREKRSPYLVQLKGKRYALDEWRSDARSSQCEDKGDRTTVPMSITYSTPQSVHGVLVGVNPSHRKSGKDAFMSNLVWLPTFEMKGKEHDQ